MTVQMRSAPRTASRTVPHDSIGKFGGGLVLLKPASPGTGVIAGGAMRAVLESAGVHNVLAKSKGSSNPHNVVKATFNALSQLRNEEQYKNLRRGDETAAAEAEG